MNSVTLRQNIAQWISSILSVQVVREGQNGARMSIPYASYRIQAVNNIGTTGQLELDDNNNRLYINQKNAVLVINYYGDFALEKLQIIADCIGINDRVAQLNTIGVYPYNVISIVYVPNIAQGDFIEQAQLSLSIRYSDITSIESGQFESVELSGVVTGNNENNIDITINKE